ncbi:DUF721 domain-containing protein [Dongia mobilis]|jgi:hypothetical protein|uniref:DUF721 domain-containing protein n=1 Tax=Dongia sp. TaxID=1977262 RepID=UPI0026EE967D
MSDQERKPKPGLEAERRNRLSALASNVPNLTKLALGRKGFAEAGLIGAWPTIVGEEIARLAIPVKMRLPRPKGEKAATPAIPSGVVPNVAGGTLTLRASSAASLEVQHLKPRILERITRYFGYPAITEIKIEIGDRRKAAPKARRPAPGPATPLDLSKVSDPEIREALQRLGAARAKRP